MPAFTSFLNLYKPGGGSSGTITPDETVDIDRLNNNSDLIDSWAAGVASALSSLLPTGSVIPFGGDSAPTGWLIADGAEVSRSTYSDLFAVVGTKFGAGNGTTTFNVPNLKGRVIAGKDASQTEFDTVGKSGGAKTHSLTSAENGSHTHTQAAHNHYIDGPTGGQLSGYSGAGSGSGAGYTPWFGGGFGAQPAGVSSVAPTINSSGSGAPHNNLQPYLTMNYLIKS